MSPLDLGIFLPSLGDQVTPLGDVAGAARHAEDLGYESVWVVDQLVAGDGNPILDSGIALAAAAAATSRIGLGYGVAVLPLRPVVWMAKQVASLQHVSADRVLLGVGAGGDRHELSWSAAGVERSERGRRTDEALAVLPDLIAGRPVRLSTHKGPGQPAVRLAPGASVPPIVVGGMSDAAMRRAAAHGDGWFLLPVPPAAVVEGRERLEEMAAARGRPMPSITASVMVALDGDPTLPRRDALMRELGDPAGRFGIPPEAVPGTVVTGGVDALVERLEGYAEVGADRVVVSVAGGDWRRQAELVAAARARMEEPAGRMAVPIRR